MDLIIRPSSNDTIAIALGGKLKGIKVKNSWVTLYLSQDDFCKIQYTLENYDYQGKYLISFLDRFLSIKVKVNKEKKRFNSIYNKHLL
jgi:hypothetical protein